MNSAVKGKRVLRLAAASSTAAVVATVALCACPGAPVNPWYGKTQPNLLVVIMDTTRGDRCSVNGHTAPTTPCLEALGRKGAVFRNCWSPSAWTAPAHASLFTGLRPVNHGFMTDANMYLVEPRVTLAEILLDEGYATGCFSTNTYVAPGFGLTQGFEHYVPTFEGHDGVGYRSPLTHGLAAEWIGEQRLAGKPWFVFINDLEPHNPYEPPPEFAMRMAGDASPEELDKASDFRFPETLAYCLGAVGLTQRQRMVLGRLYDGEIAYLDDQIGLLLDRLEREGALENTIVVVAADHGENLGDHALAEHQFSLHRTLLHVPLVVYCPPAFRPGTVIDDVVRLEDLFPTLLELCGAQLPEDEIDGASLLRELPGRIARADYGEPRFMLAQAAQLFPQIDASRFATSMRSVFDGRYHLIRRSNGVEQLFDVTLDPLELHDLSKAPPIDLGALRALLDP